MLYISYDISNDRTRAKFHKFLRKYGRSIQYSVFEIRNSPRVLSIIMAEIQHEFEKKFTKADSIVIIPVSPADMDKIVRYGHPAQEELEILFL